MGKGGSVSDREGTVMSQDAPVNTGAIVWPGLLPAEQTVARMQAKLHLWAARDPGRRRDSSKSRAVFSLVRVLSGRGIAGRGGGPGRSGGFPWRSWLLRVCGTG